MKTMTEKYLRKELIKILNKSKIEEILYEPRYYEEGLSYEYGLRRTLRGAVITIRTSLKNEK